MDFGVKTNIGTRKTNQDFYYKSEKHSLYIIADGMGGHNAGEIASRLSTELVAEDLELKLNDELEDEEIIKILEESIKRANKIVYDKSLSKKEYKGMGTTISLAYIKGEKLFIGHVGDSSIFIVSGNEIVKVTIDHSLVEELLKNGTITEEEAKVHPQKNVITRAVGTDVDIEVDVFVEKIKKEDIILLCTDGLTNMIEKEEIKEKIEKVDSLEEACKELVDDAKYRGGRDNITIMAIKI